MYSLEYDKATRRATEFIFGNANQPEMIHKKIDLHGMLCDEAKDIVFKRLQET